MPISYDNAYDLSRDEARVFQRATVAAVRAALDLYERLFAFVLCADTQFANAAALRQATDATLLASVKAAWPAMAGA